MLNPKFEVSRINSMQWNRTQNVEIFSVAHDRLEKKSIPPEVLAKVQDLLERELVAIAKSELTASGSKKEPIVTVNVKAK